MSSETRVGQLATKDAGRDAIHVPILPVIAVKVMQPGERTANGVVDPWLDKPVQPGEWFYLWVRPGTVTSLRHVWQHPAFDEEKA